jgi:ribonucleoside-triphosphate reductase
MNDLQKYVHQSRYARFLPDKQRRETWEETVTRYCDFWKEKYPDTFPYEKVYQGIVNMEVMPSMRSFMTAGRALERDHMAGYNCTYVAIDDVRAFDEILYILCCGTGVGFSVERQYIAKLPEVAEEFHPTDTTIVVRDSKIGWATSFRELLSLLYRGVVPTWDVSKVRPAGAKLKTFGGRASGPEPLVDLFRFTINLFKSAAGRKLSSIECHDLVCKIADIVVVGGVRRSALISLSNLTDERIRVAKSGSWWEHNVQRALANNSVAYTEKPDIGIFMKEWQSLYDSKSGERGIFNRVAAKNKATAIGRRDPSFDFGTNPCAEIILRSAGVCNLSEVIVRDKDSYGELLRKVELATILGTFQSTLTNFRYLRNIWKRNAEEERLLGVSLTGIMDHPFLNGSETDDVPKVLEELKQHAISTNKYWAEKLGINPSTAITTVKPSGTVSQLVDSASGIHPRYSSFYTRTVRADKKDPLSTFLIEQGVPVEEDITKPSNWVFSFPSAAPSGAITRNDRSAIQQLQHYLLYSDHWCEHNVSVTIYVREHEWLEVGAWVYKHFDSLGGVSFLPHSDHSYRQAPYQEITEAEYKKALETFPTIKWEEFLEQEDNVESYRELACVAGYCELP